MSQEAHPLLTWAGTTPRTTPTPPTEYKPWCITKSMAQSSLYATVVHKTYALAAIASSSTWHSIPYGIVCYLCYTRQTLCPAPRTDLRIMSATADGDAPRLVVPPYRSPAQACLAQARADSSSGAPATSPPPSGSPTGSAAGGPTRAAPTDRSTPEDIAAAGEYSPATVLAPLFTLRTPQGLMLRFQLPESKGPSPMEQAWHFTIEALPSASSAPCFSSTPPHLRHTAA